MTSREILDAARAGDLGRLAVERNAIGDAVLELAQSGDAPSALELVGRTWRAWLSRDELAEGSAVIAAALGARGGGNAGVWRVRALYADGIFAFRSGDQARSRASNEEALRIARELGDARGECDALTGLARVALRDGDYADVVELARQGRERAMSAGDREAGAGPLHLQAAGTRLQGDYSTARELYIESLRLNTELGNKPWMAMELQNLGWVELHLGHVDEAKTSFHKRDVALDSDADGDPWTELNWAAIEAAEGNAVEAKRRFDIGASALEELGRPLDPDDLLELEWLKKQVRG